MIKLDASVHLCIESISEVLLKSHLNIRQANNCISYHIHKHIIESFVARILKRGQGARCWHPERQDNNDPKWDCSH